MAVLTEPVPSAPAPQHFPGAYLVGMTRTDRGAEYGAPAVMACPVSFTPQHVTRPSGHSGVGDDIPPADFASIVGRAPAIGVVRRS